MKNTHVAAEEILQNYRKQAEDREEQSFHPKAAYSKNHVRQVPVEKDHRLCYRRDVDRIIHSKAYMRYNDKTQVVYLVDNDHITHRGLHVQLVNNFSQGIGEILHLNLDLIEAIALGHDVGHPPFGHEGEGYLSELSEEHGNGIFAHPWQSCRLLNEIESLNLGLNVYDGFLCHDGGMASTKLSPVFGKTWEDHITEKKAKIADPDKDIIPATLEGCLVKLCDTMSYLGKDIEDAIALGIIDRNQIPKTSLGSSNKQILNSLARDVIVNSYNKDYIAVSEEAFEALKIIRSFNFKEIYTHPKLKVESLKIKRCYRLLFETLLNDLNSKGDKSFIWEKFLNNKPSAYLENESAVRMVTDFMSGMTDNYFIKTLQKVIVPSRIEIL
ncbi:MAG: HD domain-containing protein [Parachlamydiaceae bacterium]|nr:HD domain-containing protein [Parachlamydiaceae bacterium]